MAQLVKNLPAMQETWVWSLRWEDPLEKGISPVFWPGEFRGLYRPWGHKKSDTTERLSLSLSLWAFLGDQMVKHLPATWETWVRSLGWGDPLEKEMATQSSILAWKIPWTEDPSRLQSIRSKRVGHDWTTSLSLNHWYLWIWSCVEMISLQMFIWGDTELVLLAKLY